MTLEPCAHRSERGPACADLIAAAGLARVVAGIGDPDPRTAGAGFARLRDGGHRRAICLDTSAAAPSLAGYLTRADDRLPACHAQARHVARRLRRARGRHEPLDHRRAGARACPPRRARADAILVGGGTWRADAPALDVRLPGLEDRSPRRWVLTRGAGARRDGPPSPRPTAIAGLAGVQYLYVEGGAQTAAAFLAARTWSTGCCSTARRS